MAFAERVKYPSWTSRIEIHVKLVSCVCIEDGSELAKILTSESQSLGSAPLSFSMVRGSVAWNCFFGGVDLYNCICPSSLSLPSYYSLPASLFASICLLQPLNIAN